MLKKFIKNDKVFIVGIVIIFAIFFYFLPYTHDDWAWGGRAGLARMNSFFENYNGRYFSNILVVFLTKSHLIKAIIMSVTYSSIVFLIIKIFNIKRTVEIIFILILMVLMDRGIFTQAVAWTSGFVNYVLPLPFIFILLYYNKDIFKDKKYKINIWVSIILIISGFLGSLIVEHVTIYNVILPIFIIIYNKWVNKSFNIANLFYLIGSIVGAVIMFSNGAYSAILNSQDGYRTISDNSNLIIKIIKGYYDKIYLDLILNQSFLIIIISVLLFLITNNYKKTNKNNKIVKILLTIILFYNFYILLRSFVFISIEKIFYVKLFEGILSGVFIISIAVLVYYLIKDKEIIKKLLFLIASIILIAAPLIFVTPVGPRCFFPTYIYFVIFAVILFKYVMDNKIIREVSSGYIKVVLLFVISLLMLVYGQIILVNIFRVNYIKDKTKTNVEILKLPKLPFSEYHWGGNPVKETFIEHFKYFYGIKDNVKIELYSYSEWKKLKDK